MKYLVKCDSHHHSELPGWRRVIDVPDDTDPMYAALVRIWGDGGIDDNSINYQPPTPQQWAMIMARGLNGDHLVLALPCLNPQDEMDKEPIKFSFTYHPSGHVGDPDYAWFGMGDIFDQEESPDKHMATWIYVEPFMYDSKRIDELNDLTYDELVELVLQLEAEAQ